MWFWFFMLFSNMLIPIIMIIFGAIFSKTSQGEINDYFGYRTKMSRKNNDTWEFAHKYFGQIWLKWGIIMTPITVVAMLPTIGTNDDKIGIIGGIISVLQIVVIFVSIGITERALKKTFDEDGNRR